MKKIHKAWFMLFGCCMLQGGSLGMIHNCRGVFYSPIIEDLGFKMGAFTFYMLFFGVCSCFIMPFLGKLFAKYDLRLVLSIPVVIFTGTVFAMATFNTLPAFYIAGALQGLSGAFLMFYPAPLILGNWFKKKAGLAIGISAAFSGLIGVVGNPIATSIILNHGWRMGYVVLGLLSLAMMLPVSLFLLRLKPADCGLLAYGDDGVLACPVNAKPEQTPAECKDLSLQTIRRSPYYWLMILAGLFAAATASYYTHLSSIATTFGYTATLGALFVSLSMAGNVTSKIILGQIYDRFGLNVALTAGCTSTAIGFALLLIPSLPIRLLGSFLCGVGMAMSAIMCAISVKDVFGTKHYNELLTFVSMVATLGTSLMTCATGFIVDQWGRSAGYIIAILLGIIITGLMALSFYISVKGGRKLE